MQTEYQLFAEPGHGHAKGQSVHDDLLKGHGLRISCIDLHPLSDRKQGLHEESCPPRGVSATFFYAPRQKKRNFFSAYRLTATLCNITKYMIWQEQGKWRGCLQSSPDQQVQAELFEELQFKLGHLSRERTGDKPAPLRKIA